MEIKEIKIPIEQESIEYLEKVFKDYKEVNKPIEEIKGRCIIHIYPVEDTYNSKGELRGYCDAILCDMHVYDCKNEIVYKTNNHDSVSINAPCQTRIFKDLSTMLIIDGGVQLMYCTTLSVHELR